MRWRSVRELVVERERRQVAVENERGGHSYRLPDHAAWPTPASLPVAIVLTAGSFTKRAVSATRAAILRMPRRDGPLSPARAIEELGVALGTVAYHFRALQRPSG